MSRLLKYLSFCFLFLFLATATTNAQVADENELVVDNEDDVVEQPALALKIAALSFLSTTPALQFGVEVKTFKQQALQVEFGYIKNVFKDKPSEFDGIKLRTEYRYYQKRYKKSYDLKFFGIQHMYKVVNVVGTATVWRQSQSYQEVIPLTVKNKINSVFLVSGLSDEIGKQIYVEVSFGLGARFLNISSSELPEDAELATDLDQGIFNPIRGRGDYRFLDMFVSLKFGYYFKSF